MKTYPFILIGIIFTVSNCFSQIPDSLRHILDTAYTYKAKKDIQTTITNYYDSHRKIEEGLLFLDSIQKNTKDQSLIAWQYLLKGNLWSSLNKVDSAKSQLKRGIKVAEKNNDFSNLAGLKMNLANHYKENNQTKKALELYNQALTNYRKLNDISGVCRVHINLVGLYLGQSNFFKAENHINQLLKANKIEQSPFYAASAAMFQAMIDTSVGNYELADKRYQEAFDRYGDLDNVYYQFVSTINRSINLGHIEKNKEALDAYKKGLELFKNSGFYSDWEWKLIQPGYIRVLLKNNKKKEALKVYNDFLAIESPVKKTYDYNIASIHAHMDKIKGKTNSAIKQFEALKKEKGMADLKIANYKALENLYVANKNWEQAYNLQSLRIHLKDSVANETVKRKTAYTSQKIGLAQKEKENLELELQKEKQEVLLANQSKKNRLLIWIISTILIVLTIIFWLLIKSNHQQKLIIALQKEMHHRIKNNLGIIDAFLEVAKEEFDETHFESKLSEIQQKINGIYEVHNHLYQTENGLKIPARRYVNQLIDKLQDTFPDETVTIENEVSENLQLKAETSFCLGLIVNEFLTNAIKHAFPNQHKGAVWVQLTQNKNEGILELKDNGIGFSSDFNIDTTTSFGLRTIQLLSRQLNGNFQIMEHQGVRMQIKFPL
ncbi:tetratricopeptide repeat-containing sensor histidine kinase [Tenacibaculum aiptasiae]|uniref:tetratricopeptide repeat-containing sensor histidine kinase n=1 Tax=Tenacibaculum aiptasiae TaxID=426481 RepID=UPI00232DB72A|nr:histidine kinase dimerization/phosphoacceptor domain -containing protein [Tenacibaculum aiptasiae]